jgi:hypothetical protein
MDTDRLNQVAPLVGPLEVVAADELVPGEVGVLFSGPATEMK